jgi:CRP/FNR family cyclic AMP-dependent transcriptional regulator
MENQSEQTDAESAVLPHSAFGLRAADRIDGLPEPGEQRSPDGANGWLSVVEFDRFLNPRPRGWSAAGSKRLLARAADIAPGPFDPMGLIDNDPDDWRGLLVVEGLALVQVAAGRAPIGWLVGADDLVRPWEMAEVSLLAGASWQALSPLRVALLDGDFARRAGGLDTVSEALVAKAAQTSNWLFAKSLVTGTSVIGERLLLLFALLGERWGKATSAGVVVAMPLTHQVLATLVGARRPSVSTALRELSGAGFLRRVADGWLLCRTAPTGQPPRPPCWPQYAEALGLALSQT